MPTYIYKCNECKVKWEKNNIISERYDGGDCPECGSNDIKLTIAGKNAVVVKGPGYAHVSLHGEARHKKKLAPGEANPDGTLY